MKVELYETNGDLIIRLQDPPKGLKDKLQDLIAGAVIKELKGLVKTVDSAVEPVENLKPIVTVESKDTDVDDFRPVTDEDDCPFIEKSKLPKNQTPEEIQAGPSETEETKTALDNENLPFANPRKTGEKKESKKTKPADYDPFA